MHNEMIINHIQLSHMTVSKEERVRKMEYSNMTKEEIIGMEFFESIYAIKEENSRQ